MLGLDTNVLVRLLVDDEQAQADRARRLIERCAATGEEVYVSLLVLLETEWVLRSRYGFDKAQVRTAMDALLETRELCIEDESAVETALYHWDESAADFADCLIAACHNARGCRVTATFDARAARSPGLVAA
jgi:predicted nucleic-acid-binding protein